MRVVVVSADLPFPPRSGGLIRTYHLSRVLSAAGHRVTLACFRFGPEAAPELPVRVCSIPWAPPPLYADLHGEDAERSARAHRLLDVESGEPWYASFYASEAMERLLEAQAARGVDVALFEGSDMARYLPILEGRAATVLDFLDVASRVAREAAEGSPPGPGAQRKRRELERTRRFEADLARRASLSLVVSDREAEAARELLGAGRVLVVPNGVDVGRARPFTGEPEPGAVLFTGLLRYGPNADGATWLVKRVWPAVRAASAGARLHVVGDAPRELVQALAAPDVVFHGQVPDMAPHLARAQVVAVPIVSGGGTRLKLLEAAAWGKAIVSTTRGAEGLGFEAGRDFVIADDPLAFAQALGALLASPEGRLRLGRRARERSLDYDWDRLLAGFPRRLEELAVARRRPAPR